MLGYELSELNETDGGVTAKLKLIGEPVDAFGQDITDLTLEVEYQDEDREFRLAWIFPVAYPLGSPHVQLYMRYRTLHLRR
jgi:hypothetical protein